MEAVAAPEKETGETQLITGQLVALQGPDPASSLYV